MGPTGDLWAVGDDGLIWHKPSDGSWSENVAPDAITSDDLYAVYPVSKNRVWAVGQNGVILEYNGYEWTEHSESGNFNDLYDLSFVDENLGWAVGEDREVARWF